MKNAETLNKYLLERAANEISEATRELDQVFIGKLDAFFDKPFLEISRDDMIRFVAHFNAQGYSPKYVHTMKAKVKVFFNWLYCLDQGEYPDCVKWMRSTNPRKNTKSGGMELPVKPKDILTPQDIFQIVDAATHPRDQALVILTYETAGRSGEILNLKIASVQLESDRAHVTLEGSTGSRRILVVDSVPYIQTWLNVHPSKHNKGTPLFPALYGPHKGRKMASHNFVKIVKRLRRDAQIEKPVRPHLLRHARLTEMAKHLTDAQLKNFAGWSQSSRMASVYVHLAGKDLDQPIMEMHGLAEKPRLAETPLKEQICLRGHKNKATAAFCNTCGIILNREKALELQKQEREKTEEIKDLKTQVNNLSNLLLHQIEIVKEWRNRQVELAKGTPLEDRWKEHAKHANEVDRKMKARLKKRQNHKDS